MKKSVGAVLACLLMTVSVRAFSADAINHAERLSFGDVSVIQTVFDSAATGEQALFVTSRTSPFCGVMMDVLPEWKEGQSLIGTVSVKLSAFYMDEADICACLILTDDTGERVITGPLVQAQNGCYVTASVMSAPLDEKPRGAFLTVRNGPDSEMPDLYIDDFFAEAREPLVIMASPEPVTPTPSPTTLPTDVPIITQTIIATSVPTNTPDDSPTAAPTEKTTVTAALTAAPTETRLVEPTEKTTKEPLPPTERPEKKTTELPHAQESLPPATTGQTEQEKRKTTGMLISSAAVTAALGGGIGVYRWLKGRKYHE